MNNLNLSELLPVDKFFEKEYQDMIKLGKNYLNNKKITIISLARNIDKYISLNIPLIYNFFDSLGASCSWVIFENDSTDNTKINLKNISSNNDNIHILSQDFNRKHYGAVKEKARIVALSEYRNRAKEYAKNIVSDFIIVLDLDFNSINLDGLLNSFGWLASDNSIDAVSGNSFEYKKGLTPGSPERYNLWNYDSWAFRNSWWLDLHNFRPVPQNVIDPMLWFGLWIPPTGSRPIKVNSAFGGCCIYRSNIYFLTDYDHIDCEHVCFHYNQTFNTKRNFVLVLNPSQQMLF